MWHKYELLSKFPNSIKLFSRNYGLRIDALDPNKVYDVVVIGGGHAGAEACSAAARMGAKTLLVTHKFETIGEMSCNPAFGGIGKGHLIREIDALDGVCGRCCDISGVMYRVLNTKKGPAVWGPRAQIDRKLYKKAVQTELLENTPNLDIYLSAVEDLLWDDVDKNDSEKRPSVKQCNGIILADGTRVVSKTVVITTGTFLRGQINIGLNFRPAGRLGDEPAIGLAQTLERLAFRMGRMKTGTPPRIKKESIDFTNLLKQTGDTPPVPFSFMNDEVWIDEKDQLATFQLHTPQSINSIIKDNLHVNHHVTQEVTGPRYCPSLEAKVLRFSEKSHRIWLEPEGLDSDLIYPNGLSNTLPEELQWKLVRSLPGLKNAVIAKFGYGVTYDYVDPRELYKTLETRKMRGLFFAGQINGTTGYEEAAAQGILAGANAAAKAQNKIPLTLNRTQAYIGVLVDDLTEYGTNEPYRMFTSRAEFRLTLRPDNADFRLTPLGYEMGLVSQKRYDKMCETKERMEKAVQQLNSTSRSIVDWRNEFGINISNNLSRKNAYEMLSLPNDRITMQQIAQLYPNLLGWARNDHILCNRIKIEALYARAENTQQRAIEEVQKDEQLLIPSDLDYLSKSMNMSNEEREKLAMIQPQTIAAASRVQGITPSGIVELLRFVKRRNHKA